MNSIAVVPIPSRARKVWVYGWFSFNEETGYSSVGPDLFWLRAEDPTANPPDGVILSFIPWGATGNPGYIEMIVPTNATHLLLSMPSGARDTEDQSQLTWVLEL